METAPPLQMSLDVVMADKEQLWNKMIEKHGLARHSYKDVSSWLFGDFVFAWDYDFFADGTTARRLGFHEFVDTEEMFMNIFDDFRKRKVSRKLPYKLRMPTLYVLNIWFCFMWF